MDLRTSIGWRGERCGQRGVSEKTDSVLARNGVEDLYRLLLGGIEQAASAAGRASLHAGRSIEHERNLAALALHEWLGRRYDQQQQDQQLQKEQRRELQAAPQSSSGRRRQPLIKEQGRHDDALASFP